MKKTKNEIEKPTNKWQVKDRLYEEINSGKIKAKTLKRLEKNMGNN